MPTPLFKGLKIHSHTALLFGVFFKGITKVVDPLPESKRGGFNGWLRVQANDEVQEVRGRL